MEYEELLDPHQIGFRTLTESEDAQFRKYAKENPPGDIRHWYTYHPACREEWKKQGIIPPAFELLKNAV